MSHTTTADHHRSAVIFAVSQAVAYVNLGLDFLAIRAQDGESTVITEPRVLGQSQVSFVSTVCLMSGIAWRQERHGQDWIAHIVRDWQEEAEDKTLEGISEIEPSSLYDTYDEISSSAPAALAFILANRELIEEAADYVEAAGGYIEYAAFAALFLDRIMGPNLEHMVEAEAAFAPHKQALREIGLAIGTLRDEEERVEARRAG